MSKLYLLAELLREDVDMSGDLRCPGCGSIACALNWSGVIEGFEDVCDGCDAQLFPASVVVQPDEWARENGGATVEELRECVLSAWERRIDEGIVDEQTGDVITPWFVEQTEELSDEFGWKWEPPVSS